MWMCKTRLESSLGLHIPSVQIHILPCKTKIWVCIHCFLVWTWSSSGFKTAVCLHCWPTFWLLIPCKRSGFGQVTSCTYLQEKNTRDKNKTLLTIYTEFLYIPANLSTQHKHSSNQQTSSGWNKYRNKKSGMTNK